MIPYLNISNNRQTREDCSIDLSGSRIMELRFFTTYLSYSPMISATGTYVIIVYISHELKDKVYNKIDSRRRKDHEIKVRLNHMRGSTSSYLK